MPETEPPSKLAAKLPAKFGTFGGVFTPSTLTILGVIMFLRFGEVVGQAGIANCLIIILCAKLITTLTTFSISAIATNTRVKGGGAYFLISRSLGVEFGGAIGIVFFLAQAISVAMYVIGFTEAFLYVFPGLGFTAIQMASFVNLVVFMCVYIGAGWTIKLQYGILAVLALSLLSFYLGAIPKATSANFEANFDPSYLSGGSLFTMFALFFPAVTGIMAGVNMSGDLQSPSKSIPKGTLLAIAVTGLVYLSMAVLLGASSSRSALATNNFVMLDIARWPMLINAGIFAATLSSALGSMMGAPRILQALARDNIFPSLRRFGRGSGASGEPRAATVLTFAIAQVCVLLGDLNAIAPIITMFFMLTYGTINFACFRESITGNPSYRPAFRFSHWCTALLGALGCAAVMILINPLWAFVSILAMAVLHFYISRKEVEARWGDLQSGAAFERARRALLRLEEERYHPKNWRPIILALSGGAWMRNHLAEFGYWFTAGHGVLSLGQIISGDVEDQVERRISEEDKLRKFIANEDLEAFPAVVVEDDLMEGVKTLLQSHGIGGFRPNTVMLGWSEDPERYPTFFEMLRLIRELGRSIIIVRSPRERGVIPEGPIDIWWRGGSNGTLMLLLAHLLAKNPQWRNRKIRVLSAIGADKDPEKASARISEMLATARIKADPEIVAAEDSLEVMRRRSADSALVLIGFELPEEGGETECGVELNATIEGFDNVVLVSSSGGMSLGA